MKVLWMVKKIPYFSSFPIFSLGFPIFEFFKNFCTFFECLCGWNTDIYTQDAFQRFQISTVLSKFSLVVCMSESARFETSDEAIKQ